MADAPVNPPHGTVDRHAVAALFDEPDASLVDAVDGLLDKGVMLDGELILSLAHVDLIYLRLSVLLVAAERVLVPPRDSAAADAAPK